MQQTIPETVPEVLTNSQVSNLFRVSLLLLFLDPVRGEKERINPADGGNKNRLIPRADAADRWYGGQDEREFRAREGDRWSGWRRGGREWVEENLSRGGGRKTGRVGVVMRGCEGGGRERSLAEFGFLYFSLSLALLGVARIPFLPH